MSEKKRENEERKNGDLLSPHRIGRRATPVVDFVNRETEAHDAARFVLRLRCFFFLGREGRRMRKEMGKVKQDIRERHSKGISEREMAVVRGGDGEEVQAKRSSS